MPRVKLIRDKDDLPPEQQALHEKLAASRGRLSGTSSVVMYSPDIAGPWSEISDYLHGESTLDQRQAELAISATAREYDCAYIWASHAPAARNAGVSELALVAIRDGRSHTSLPEDEADILLYVRQLVRTNRIDDVLFGRLLKAFGERWLVELTVFVAAYAANAGILNTFEVLRETGSEPLPDVAAFRGPAATAARPPQSLPRVKQITTREQVTEEGHPAFDAVSEGRGNVRGPYSILMYSPKLCHSVLRVSSWLNHDSEIQPPLRALVTIATARERDCSYLWAVHVPRARKEGISDAVISSVRTRGELTNGAFSEPERDVVDFIRQLLRDHRVTQELFDRLREEHGITWLVDLTCYVGSYGILSAILNAFEIAPPADAESF